MHQDVVQDAVDLACLFAGPERIEARAAQFAREKRADARERYVKFALDTLVNPYEIWETMYDDGMVRYIFIGTYKQKQQMLVVVAPWDGKVLWNFMHTEAKGLNKHRRGSLLYSR